MGVIWCTGTRWHGAAHAFAFSAATLTAPASFEIEMFIRTATVRG